MSRHIQLVIFMMLGVDLFQASGASLISPAAAHDPRPILIDIYQDDARPGEMNLEWKIPGSLSPRKHPTINFATACNLIRTSAGRFEHHPPRIFVNIKLSPITVHEIF